MIQDADYVLANALVNYKELDAEKLQDLGNRALKPLPASVPGKMSDNEHSQELDKTIESQEDEESDLLFHPLAVFPRNRQITQICLLSQKIERMKTRFNMSFDRLLDNKRGIVETIAGNNKRLNDIIEELKMPEELFQPKMHGEENPDEILSVKDSEIQSVYIPTEEEQIARAAKEAAASSRDANQEAGLRALDDMMHGTLETKKDLGILDDPIRPEWIDDPATVLTDEQKVALIAYEKEVKEVAAAREARQRMLETEMKKIKGESAEIIKTFDDKAKCLKTQGIHLQKLICRDEYVILSLLNTLIETEHIVQVGQLFEKCLSDLEEEQTKREHTMLDFADLCEQTKADRERIGQELSNLDKGFRRELEAESGEHVEQLYKLFRLRVVKVKEKSPRIDLDELEDDEEDEIDLDIEKPVDVDTNVLINPFENESLSKEDESLPLPDSERPDGVEAELWASLQKKRVQKLVKEANQKQFGILLVEMNKRQNQLEAAVGETKNQLNLVHKQKSDFEHCRIQLVLNNEVMLKLEQGLVEIEESPVVTDLQACQFVTKKVVEDLNKNVIKLGKENVVLLKEMMRFRNGITALHWERKRLELTHQDAEDLTKELQLLRVTKSLQALIKAGGQDSKSQAEVALMERKFDHLRQITIQELAIRKKKLAQFRVKVRHQTMENRRLGASATKLESLVAERMQISKLRDESGLGHQIVGEGKLAQDTTLTLEQEKKMEAVAERRQLMNIADAQKAELHKLQVERDRLRMRTFPSFNVASRSRHAPDERMARDSGQRFSGVQTARFSGGMMGPSPPKGSRTHRARGRELRASPSGGSGRPKPFMGVWGAPAASPAPEQTRR